MNDSENIEEPQNDANDDDGVQNGLDASRHGDETIHQPQQNANHDQDDHELNERHDGFFSFFARRHPASQVVDPFLCAGSRADAPMWNEVEPGISRRFRLKLGYSVSLRFFCFPTNDIVEERPADVCPFAHTFVLCLPESGGRPGPGRVNAAIGLRRVVRAEVCRPSGGATCRQNVFEEANTVNEVRSSG